MLLNKQCQNCDISFKPRADSPGIFCSKSCNATYHNSRRVRKEKPSLQCLCCGINILSPNKFCGRSCSAVYNNRLRLQSYQHKTCATCGTKFIGKIYCSRQCSAESKKKPLEYRKAKARETYKRYIARKKYQTPVGTDLKAIQEFYINCPIGYEVDHIIPISKGGAHSLENLQYLTKEENRRKSNRLLVAEAGFEPAVSRV